jgi:Zn-dependent peptidase ImmA (M78 family)
VEVAVAAKALEEALRALGGRAPSLTPESWRWLIPRRVVEEIERSDALQGLLARLRAQVPARGVVIPHSLESLALQGALPEERALLALADALGSRGEGPSLSATLQGLRRWSQATTREPWREGYQRALEVREALGWGDAPSPCLSEWLAREGVSVGALQAPAEVVSLAAMDREARAWIWANAAANYNPGMSLAASWGHFLMDARPDADYAVTHLRQQEGAQARARAFAAMLLMPREGVRDALGGQRSAEAVQRVMERFGTSAGSATWHLMNLGFLGEEERVEIASELRG